MTGRSPTPAFKIIDPGFKLFSVWLRQMVSAYEEARLARIKENARQMELLGITGAAKVSLFVSIS